ncbi:SDR family NAD(P)-dependent oxidoreductase [Colwellia sp. UCD-KL20]|uniref:SDR family NAD(P)-dependent oxidoreductase n=1 Tax=Colwellia sp. UCD-KL20 TaxID=1917165 RepID=UPI000970FDAD|nr:SDR family NAD(P)-dependent oxidoreductase [Colwellia sp. UCD-KL20]
MKIIIISASSDIGYELCKHWIAQGHEVRATYRNLSSNLASLTSNKLSLLHCDLSSQESIERATLTLSEFSDWDQLVVCPGTMLPIGSFENINFKEWQDSFQINLFAQMQLTHSLLPSRNKTGNTGVIFFAGGGTNSAPINFSAYTLSKVTLIKACELLNEEMNDCKFTILGPGWVKTKIHQETLLAVDSAGAKEATEHKYATDNEWTSFEDIACCCDWVFEASKSEVGGRNFSVVHDNWRNNQFSKKLQNNSSLGKLRRAGNDELIHQ